MPVFTGMTKLRRHPGWLSTSPTSDSTVRVPSCSRLLLSCMFKMFERADGEVVDRAAGRAEIQAGMRLRRGGGRGDGHEIIDGDR